MKEGVLASLQVQNLHLPKARDHKFNLQLAKMRVVTSAGVGCQKYADNIGRLQCQRRDDGTNCLGHRVHCDRSAW